MKVPIADIKLNPSNPRTITGEKFDKLVKSIRDFPEMLDIRPVVVNNDMVVLGGNMRLKAAQEAGMTEIAVIKASDLTPEQQREFIIKDNVGFGDWDWELIGQDWDMETLSDFGIDEFDLETGFYDQIFAGLDKQNDFDKYKDEIDDKNDGILDLVGYDLYSVWPIIEDGDTETGKYLLSLPINPNDKSRQRMKYSRTHPCGLEKIVKTYMREGDYFLESCVGWASFSSVAKFYGYSGIGVDIWDKSLKYCKRQLQAMPGKGKVDIQEMDAMELTFDNDTFDIVYSNPPFFNLEGYKQDEKDISNTKSYSKWLESMDKMSRECHRVLKPGGLAIFTMADFRVDGSLVNAHSDWIGVCDKIGFKFHDHAIQKIKSMAITLRKRDYERRRCVKAAEHILVFKK